MNRTLRNRVLPLLVPSSLLLALPAVAQEGGSGGGFSVGLRAGYGLPAGDAIENGPLDEIYGGVFAPQLDVGYFLNRNVYLGVYGQFGFAQIQDDSCPVTLECDGRVLRFGVDVNYHFTSTGVLSPWLGLGVGYEIAELEVRQGNVEGSNTLRGMEFIHLQGGIDFQLSKQVWLGPYVMGTVGQYSRAAIRLGEGELSGDVQDKAVHYWLQPGLRLQVRL